MPVINFGSFSKRRNSTKRPSSLPDSRNCKLKETTSFDAPTFIITGDDFDYNYAQWGSRYYFITDIRSVHNGLTEIDCVLDVLATGKDYILASTQYVCYSSHNSNTWLPDTRIPLVKATDTNRNTYSMGALFNTVGFYVLTAVGQDGCVAYAVDKATLDAILESIQDWEDDGVLAALQQISTPTSAYQRAPYRIPAGSTNQECFKSLNEEIVDGFESIGNMFVDFQASLSTAIATVGASAVSTGFVGNAYSQAPSCIRSCIWVPFFATPFTDTGKDLYLGNFPCKKNGTQIRPFTLKASAYSDEISVTIPWHYSDWRRGICEDVYLYLPMVGMIQLSSTSITNVTTLTVKWSATATDGVICYEVKADGNVIGTYSGQCAANYPIGINQQASAGEIAQSILSGLHSTVAAGMQTAEASASLNPVSSTLGAAAGGINTLFTGVQSGYDVINTMNTSHASCVGGIGGGAGSGLDLDIQCYTVCHETVMTPADMKDTMGLPTMLPYPLATLTGYCQCANAHVEAPLMASELDAIDAYLNSGFFIE